MCDRIEDDVYDSEQDDGGDFVTDLESAVMSLVLVTRVKELVDGGELLPPEYECE